MNFRDAGAAGEAVASLNGTLVTSDGDTRPKPSEEYDLWLRRSWDVDAESSSEYDDEIQAAARLIAIVKDASRCLAEHVAKFPRALMQIEWRDFERMLATVFEGIGFAVTCGRGSKDGGIDLIVRAKSSTYIVQAKHWTSGKKVGGSVLKATISIALHRGADAGIVLSSSGFAKNAATAVTTLERARLCIGGCWEIHSLCRTFVGASQGLLLSIDADAIVRTHTRGPVRIFDTEICRYRAASTYARVCIDWFWPTPGGRHSGNNCPEKRLMNNPENLLPFSPS